MDINIAIADLSLGKAERLLWAKKYKLQPTLHNAPLRMPARILDLTTAWIYNQEKWMYLPQKWSCGFNLLMKDKKATMRKKKIDKIEKSLYIVAKIQL